MVEWFERWFGEEYLRLYPHRDDEEAARAVATLDAHIGFGGRRVLDLACGPGRHAIHLRRAGASVVGIDLSMPLLARARLHAGPALALVRGDMRHLPFAADRFDAVVNLFTSFGYFTDDAQHLDVLRQAGALLRHGGVFALDFFNADLVRATLVPHESRTIGSQRVSIARRISDDGRFVVKEMHLEDDGQRFVERVRLFGRDDLSRMLEEAGLVVRESLGDYSGVPAGPDTPRVILLADRP